MAKDSEVLLPVRTQEPFIDGEEKKWNVKCHFCLAHCEDLVSYCQTRSFTFIFGFTVSRCCLLFVALCATVGLVSEISTLYDRWGPQKDVGV